MTTGCADNLLGERSRMVFGAARAGEYGACGAAVNERARFRIGPVQLELRSDMPDAAEDFTFLYRGWRHAEPGAEAIHMEIKADGRTLWGARRYAIIGDGEQVFSGLRPEEVLPYLEWGINYRVIATRNEFLQLHAATLAYGGQGVMLVGESGCGKSTLTAALVSRGWGYLSDEFALIAPDTCRLYPFPKALCIKVGSFDLVRRFGLPLWRRRPYVKAFKGRVAYVSPHELNVETGSVPIRLIVFPRYTGGRTTLHPVSRSRAAFSLAANAFNRHLFGERVVSIMGETVQGAQCVALEPGDLEETRALLESLLSNPQS